MNQTIVFLSTTVAGLLGLTAIASLCADLFFRDQIRLRQRMFLEFQLEEKQNPQKSRLFRDLKMLQSKSTEHGWREWWELFTLRVLQSGLPWSPAQVIATSIAIAVVAGTGIYVVVPGTAGPAVAGAVGLASPFFAVELFRQRRRRLLCEQLPDAFDQMKRFVRAGQSLTTAMQHIANDFPSPLADEFAMCCQQQDLGLSQPLALQDLARRVNIMELQMFVVVILVQRDVGGNTAEILGNLANVVRQRFRLASRVKSLTAEGRMQAMVLTALPLIAGLLMTTLNYEYARVLLDRPKILCALAVSEVIGVVWIRRIVNFNF